jgi:hypothetical protein
LVAVVAAGQVRLVQMEQVRLEEMVVLVHHQAYPVSL